MTMYLRALREVPEPEEGEPEGGQPGSPIRFVASTEGVKRDGKSLDAEKWQLDNFRANPVGLWGHDYWGERLPIARADVSVEDGRLMASMTFDQEDEFARAVEGKYRRGFLNAVSVGWDETEDGYELLDISAVPVPGDPDALMERQMRAFRALADQLNSVMQSGPQDDDPEPDVDPEPDPEPDDTTRGLEGILQRLNKITGV